MRANHRGAARSTTLFIITAVLLILLAAGGVATVIVLRVLHPSRSFLKNTLIEEARPIYQRDIERMSAIRPAQEPRLTLGHIDCVITPTGNVQYPWSGTLTVFSAAYGGPSGAHPGGKLPPPRTYRFRWHDRRWTQETAGAGG
ncbi:MAG: hypothetical protein KGJ62_09290 [Armatimonadetes bacterium]|nr:hypothetical protein [Armatimonadota bacterium]MDE2207438.1 hypothetical protein [Armatimonadota bacterium]